MIKEYLEHHFEKDPDDQFDIEWTGFAGLSVREFKPPPLGG